MATESDVMVQEEPEGFSTEAALCLLYNGLNVYTVLTVIALSMVLTGHKRRYTACRAMITDPNAPLCEWVFDFPAELADGLLVAPL